MEKSQTKSPNKTRNEAKDRVDKSKGTPPTTTKAQEFRLHTGQRALRRAMFNYSVATKIYLTELQKKQVEKLHKIIEDEEVRMMRKEMVPRAQLMPLFDRPFLPQRSNRPLTIPREPSFKMSNSKCWSCISGDELHHFQHAFGFQAH